MNSSIKNILIFGALAALSLGAFITALCHNQTIPVIIVGAVTVTGFLAVFGATVYYYFAGQPDYVLKSGTQVWVRKINSLPKPLMEDALEFYRREIVDRFKNHRTHPIVYDDMDKLYRDLNIKWSKKPVQAVGRGWVVDKAAGLQKGNVILVHWKGTVCGSALFHEINHAIDELILKIPPDYAHERKDWWEAVREIKRKYEHRELDEWDLII